MLSIFWISLCAAAIFGFYCFLKVLLFARLSNSAIAVSVFIDGVEACEQLEYLFREAVSAPIALKSRRIIILLSHSAADSLSPEQISQILMLVRKTGAEIFTAFDFNADAHIGIEKGEKISERKPKLSD